MIIPGIGPSVLHRLFYCTHLHILRSWCCWDFNPDLNLQSTCFPDFTHFTSMVLFWKPQKLITSTTAPLLSYVMEIFLFVFFSSVFWFLSFLSHLEKRKLKHKDDTYTCHPEFIYTTIVVPCQTQLKHSNSFENIFLSGLTYIWKTFWKSNLTHDPALAEV